METTHLMTMPLWQMTGAEFLELIKQGGVAEAIQQTAQAPQTANAAEARRYLYGIAGIREIFNCSQTTACRIKASGKIDRAITQIGRKIIIDADLALELAGQKTGGRRKKMKENMP